MFFQPKCTFLSYTFCILVKCLQIIPVFSTLKIAYFLYWGHNFLFTLYILDNLHFFCKCFTKIFFVLLSDFLFDNFFNGIKVIIFKNIVLETFQLLIAKGATMMPIYCFLDAAFAIDVPAPRDIAVIYWIQAYCTLKFSLQFLRINFKVNMILFCVDHDLPDFLFKDEYLK